MNNTGVGVIFSHMGKGIPTWPGKNYDYDMRKRSIRSFLETGSEGIDFQYHTCMNQSETLKVIHKLAEDDVDGILVYILGIYTRVAITAIKSNIPVIFADDVFGGSGEFLTTTAVVKNGDYRALGVASSKKEDVLKAVRYFKVLHRMRESRIGIIYDDVMHKIVVNNSSAIREQFSTEITRIDTRELIRQYQKVTDKEAKRVAGKWTERADKIIEPTAKDILKAARLHLAIERIIDENALDVFALDCLELFYKGSIPALPCMSFHELSYDGMPGICEGDLSSAVSIMIGKQLTGQIGYISDPVIDNGRGEIIYSHCFAPCPSQEMRKEPLTYHLRSHAESGESVGLQLMLPVNVPVTTLKYNLEKRKVNIHSGTAVENVQTERACRTKLAARVNTANILKNCDDENPWDWHRITYFGDFRREFADFAKLAGFDVLFEDE
jgi:L-fucose isomerase-like protein